MTDEASRIAQAIADGVEPDWREASDRRDALRVLHDIAAGFRQPAVTEEATDRPILFRWRHLDVVEKIGSGAFGEVFRALDPVLRRDVALKLAREDTARGVDARAVIAEARSMARLRHPNILAVHGADEEGDRVGIWCDLLGGRTLDAVLTDTGRLPPNDALALALPLAEALALIHARGLNHGDIKPANIMVQTDGSPVLMDFGAARGDLALSPALGSPIFMAPERFGADPSPTPAADCYAFGVLLHRMLTGHHPIDASSLEELAAYHEDGREPSCTSVPLRFRRLLRSLLSRRPADRPDSSAVVRRLERIAEAKSRWLGRGAVAVVVGSLALAALGATLAYRSEVEARDRTERVKDVIAEAVESAVPTRTSGPTTVQAMYGRLAELVEERLADYPDALAEMRMVAGVGLAKLGETERGVAIAEAGAALMAEVRADSPRDLVVTWLEIATMRQLVADLDGAEEAVRLALQALPALEKINPEVAAENRLIALNRLALLVGQQGRWVEEVRLAEELLAQRREHYGEGSIRLAVDHHNLAGAQQAIGDLDAALENERRAGELLVENGDGESARMGFVLSGLASMLIRTGRLDEAAETAARVRELYEANFPAGHRNLEYLNELESSLLVARSDYAEAEPRLRRLLTLEGEDFAQTRHLAREQLATITARQDRWNEALAWYQALRSEAPQRYHPLALWFEAAEANAAWLAGRGPHPTGLLEAARDDLNRRGLDRTRYYRQLEGWLADAPATPQP